jgi:Fic family protein
MSLYRYFHERLTHVRGGSVRLTRLVDRLFISPTVTVKRVKEESGVTYPTAKSDLKKLETLGIVLPLEGMPLATYFCAPIFDVMFGADDEDGS